MQTSPSSECCQRQVAYLAGVYGASEKVCVVVQIGQMPVQSRRVGQHAEFVLIEFQLFAHNLQHNLSASRLCYAPVDSRATRVYRDDVYIVYLAFHLVDRLEVAENP